MSLSKRAYQNWVDSLPGDEREPDERDHIEGLSLLALRSAARDLAALGWQPHDLANEVAEAVAPPAPPIDIAATDDPIPL
jgi:hypothetical protein